MRIALFTDSYLPTVDGVVTSVLSTRRQLRSEEHTSELQSHSELVCRLLPEKKKNRGLLAELTARHWVRFCLQRGVSASTRPLDSRTDRGSDSWWWPYMWPARWLHLPCTSTA